MPRGEKWLLKFVLILFFAVQFGLSYGAPQVHKEGNVFTTTSTSSRSSKLEATPYSYKGKDNVERTILINKESGRCYVKRTSQKTGKEYNASIPEEVAREVCKLMGVTYKEKVQK